MRKPSPDDGVLLEVVYRVDQTDFVFDLSCVNSGGAVNT